MAERDESPEAIAHALVSRIFGLLHECRAVLPKLEMLPARPESASAQAERVLYVALLGAIEAGLVRTMEDALTVLRQASKPVGSMGDEWFKLQERLAATAQKDGTQTLIPTIMDSDGVPTGGDEAVHHLARAQKFHVAEACRLKPLADLGEGVRTPVLGADEHVDREDRPGSGAGARGVHHMVADDEPPARHERRVDLRVEATALVEAHLVDDRRQIGEVVPARERVGHEVAGDEIHAPEKPGLAEFCAGDLHHGREIEQGRAHRGAGSQERGGVSPRSAPHIEQALGPAGADCVDDPGSLGSRDDGHRADEAAQVRPGAFTGARGGRSSRADGLGEPVPRPPEVRQVAGHRQAR
jgi:hypothetical protein